MKKRMISMAMTAVMALTLVVAAAPAEVHATTISPLDTEVSYKHTNTTGTSTYYFEIPTSVAFTEAGTKDLDVEIFNTGGSAYTGTDKVEVSIVSEHGLKLHSETNGDLEYSIKYDTSTTTSSTYSTKIAIADKLSSTKTKLEIDATIDAAEVAKAANNVSYKDKLTYNFTVNNN